MEKTLIVKIAMPSAPKLTREERLKQQQDSLMDKAEHASELLLAGIHQECALRCIRKMYAALEKYTPEHLRGVKEFIQPIINEYGSNEPDTGVNTDAKDN